MEKVCRTRKERDIYTGHMVRIFRMLSGLRREDMARAFDLSMNQYINVECGRRGLDIADIAKMCEMFGIDVSTFSAQVMFDTSGDAGGITVHYEKGAGYGAKKQRAEMMAIELQPFGYVPKFQTELERLAHRFGTVQEFKSRGILK